MVIPVASLSRATEMWKNVKALEEENQRLRKEVREWVNKALELSKRLHASDAMAVNSVERLQERLRTAAARRGQPAAEESTRATGSDAQAGRGALDPGVENALSVGANRRPKSHQLAPERPCVANVGRSGEAVA